MADDPEDALLRSVLQQNANATVHDVIERKRAEEGLRDETRVLDLLKRTGTLISSQLDLQTMVQSVTDMATELTGAGGGGAP